MVKRLAIVAASTLALVVACHVGEQRGTGSIAPDALIGCWRGPAGEALAVWPGSYVGAPFDAGESPEWARETDDLISVFDNISGTRTIQTEFDPDFSRVRLFYANDAGIQRLELTRVEPADAGNCP